MSAKFKVGVIGLGMGRHHVEGFQEHPESRVTAVCDLDENRLEAIGKRHNIKRRYTDAAEMLETEKLDIVSIATPNKFHCPLALAAF